MTPQGRRYLQWYTRIRVTWVRIDTVRNGTSEELTPQNCAWLVGLTSSNISAQFRSRGMVNSSIIINRR